MKNVPRLDRLKPRHQCAPMGSLPAGAPFYLHIPQANKEVDPPAAFGKDRKHFSVQVMVKKLFVSVCYAVLVMSQMSVASAEEDGFIDDRQCFGCHRGYKQTFKDSIHGRAFASEKALGCQSCHGGGAAHKEVAGVEGYTGPMKIESFSKGSGTAEDRSRRCLMCHERKTHVNWRGSAHEVGGVACTNCHNLHEAGGVVRQEVCFTCHKEQRAQANRPSHHPILQGQLTCSNCHNPHGSNGPKLLHKNTVNEACYTCHAEKRGPFLWEHPPASDSCTNCHTPHGSNNVALLKNRPPYLCSSCHIAGGHSTTGIRNGTDLGVAGGGTSAAPQMVGKSCLNCHPQIHGSNHPSGARFAR